VFRSGDTVTIEVTVHDTFHNLVNGASVTVTMTRPDGGTETFTGTTNTQGLAKMNRHLTTSDPSGTYTIAVTALSKTNYAQDLGSSEQSSNAFTKQ
jgi:hypothetical protein